MRLPGVLLCLAIVACGARTDLGGTDRLHAHDADAGDAGDASREAGPPPSPCVATAPVELAAGGREIQFVALDDANVYWTDFALGTVSAVPKGGGEARVLAPGRDKPSGIATHDGTLYWTDFNGNVVASMPTAGDGSVTTIASGQDGAYDVTATGDGVYWTTFRSCAVHGIQGGVSKQLDKAKQPFASIVSTDSLVFWVSFQTKSVERYEIATGARTTLLDGGSNLPFAIATDGARLYFGQTTPGGMTIGAVPAHGGAPETIYSAACGSDGGLVGSCLAKVATDGKYVYFTAASGEDPALGGVVRRVAVGGGDATVIADHQARPFAVAVDDKCVYWSNMGDGTVWAAPK